MTKCLTHGLTQSLLALYLFLLSCISFHSSEIFAEDISTSRIETKKTTQSTEILSNDKEKHSRNMKVALAEGISTKAIWFGFEQEVTIATRHETPVGKAPSIVTVITAKEIKHLGLRCTPLSRQLFNKNKIEF